MEWCWFNHIYLLDGLLGLCALKLTCVLEFNGNTYSNLYITDADLNILTLLFGLVNESSYLLFNRLYFYFIFFKWPRKRTVVGTILSCLLWNIWRARNDRIFKDLWISYTKVADNIISLSFLWYNHRSSNGYGSWVDWCCSPFLHLSKCCLLNSLQFPFKILVLLLRFSFLLSIAFCFGYYILYLLFKKKTLNDHHTHPLSYS